jgi:hypothetical protein
MRVEEGEQDYVKVRMPRWWINLAHKFRIKLHPRYDDDHYDTGIVVDCSLDEIRNRFLSWTCDLDNPHQYIYKNQVLSGHIYLPAGRQLHIRVFTHPKGYEMKAHLEWSGLEHPIRHTFYSGLDYEQGYIILKKLWFG